MVTERFTLLLQELGELMKIKLEPDSRGSCLIRYKSGLGILMQPDRLNEYVQLLVVLPQVPKGRYRENLFREALRANGLAPPRFGVFAFSSGKNAIILCDELPFDATNGAQLNDYLTQLRQKAELWYEAIGRGDVPSFTANELSFRATPGVFGLNR